jgi:YggT family protein
MSLLALVAYWALQIYFYALVGRLILDLLMSVNPSFRPKGILLPVAEIVFTVTDPPLKFVRQFIKPVRVGSISLDFGWTLLVLVVVFAQGIFRGLI